MQAIHIIYIINDNMTLGATTKNTFCSVNKMLFRADEYSSHLSAAGLVPSILTGQGQIVFRSKGPLKQLTCSYRPLNSRMTRRKELLFNETVIHCCNSWHIVSCAPVCMRGTAHSTRGPTTNTAQCSFKLQQLFPLKCFQPGKSHNWNILLASFSAEHG